MLEDFNIVMSDIMILLGGSVRPLQCGEEVFSANHILLCGIKHQENNVIKIRSRCLQSSHIADSPHKIDITITLSENNKKIECFCSCKAGAGKKCKHIFATLIYLYR